MGTSRVAVAKGVLADRRKQEPYGVSVDDKFDKQVNTPPDARVDVRLKRMLNMIEQDMDS